MNIASFVEGARQTTRNGFFNIPGVIPICKSLADQGNNVILFVSGKVLPTQTSFILPSNRLFNSFDKTNTFGIHCFPGLGKWGFTLKLVVASTRLTKRCDFVMLHSLYSFPVLVGYLLARIYKKPYGIWLHGVLAPFQREISRNKKVIYDKIIGRRILENASVIFYTASGECKETEPLGLITNSVVIPLGFNAQEFASLPEKGKFRLEYLNGYKGPIILFFGRLNAKKGLELLIEAMDIVTLHRPDVKLVIVGPEDPPAFVTGLKKQIRSLSLGEKVVILDPIIQMEEKKQMFADVDFLALPSAAENFGFAMFEALSSGVPVVISETLNYAEEIRQSNAGLVVRRDPQELATAILKLIDDVNQANRISENGKKFAGNFTWESCGRKVDQVISLIVQGQKIPLDLVFNE